MPVDISDELCADPCNNNDESPITEFFNGKTVFITGGTGFMGKATIEKLLRVTNVKKIFVLIRPKKNHDIQKRLDDLLADPLFESLKTENCKSIKDRIQPIGGDCTFPGLGLSTEDKSYLIKQAHIVIHGAATVRFDETAQVAININAEGTENIMQLCREIENLVAVSYVSTAFANCQHSHIEEQFYKQSMTTKQILYLSKNLSTDMFQRIEPELLCDSPNSYTFSKSLAENVIKDMSEGLPVSIFRPPVLIPTRNEPLTGWTDNLYGPSSILLGVATGVLRVIYVNRKLEINFAPVDMTVSALLATIWDTANSSGQSTPIYNYTPPESNKPKWSQYEDCMNKYGMKMPLLNMLWYPTVTLTSNIFLYNILFFFYQTVPGIFFDFLLALVGHKIRLNKIYSKIKATGKYINYFAENSWTFGHNNTTKLWQKMSRRDKEIYEFDLSTVDWEDIFKNSLIGMRIYLGKEGPETIPQALKKLHRLKMLHYMFLTGLYLLVFYFVFKISKLF